MPVYLTYVHVASFPGSPPPFLFFVKARGEPGNEANIHVDRTIHWSTEVDIVNLHYIPQEFVGCGEWVEPWGTLQQQEEGNPGTGEEGNPEMAEEGSPEREEGGSLELQQEEGNPEREEEGTPGRVQ